MQSSTVLVLSTRTVYMLFIKLCIARFKDGQAVGEGSVIALQDLTADDSGVYTCTATLDGLLVQSGGAHLTISGKRF